MVKIKALNELGSSDDDLDSSLSNQQLYNIETQEENLQAIYTDYLKLMSKNLNDQAKERLLKLFDLIKDLDEYQASPVQKNLKYLTYKNLGDLFIDKVDFYLEALTIDNTDINLWIKTAKRSFHKLEDYVLTRNCLEYAFKLNQNNWLIIDLLIDCYFILNDYENCLIICEHSLNLDSNYQKAHLILNQIKNRTKLIFNYSIINKQLINNDHIIKQLDDKRSKRKLIVDDYELNEIKRLKSDKFELNINLKTDTLNKFGINLIKLYSELKSKQYSIDTKINFIKINEEQLLLNQQQQNDESNSDEKSKSTTINNQTLIVNQNSTIPSSNQNSLSKDDLQQSNSRGENKSGNSFPFEYVDKRRSSRVQNIQNKNTKDLDDNALIERVNLLFYQLCSLTNNKLNQQIHKRNDSRPIKPINNQKEKECFNQFIKQLELISSNNLSDNQENKNNDNSIDAPSNNTSSTVSKNISSSDSLSTTAATTNTSITPSNKTFQLSFLNIFQQFLYFTSTKLNNLPLPTVYKDIYTIYRHHKQLPTSSLLDKINRISVDEYWSILVANEIKFNVEEVNFLTEILIYLEASLDEQEFNVFLVKLFILRGINETNLEFLEFSKTKLEQLTEPIYNINNEAITIQLIKALICSQSINNLQRLLDEKNYDKLFELLTPELQLSDNELKIVCKSILDSKEYSKGIEIFANREDLTSICFDTLLTCYKKVSNYEINSKLVDKILHIAKTQCTVQSWTILLSILMAAPESKVNESHILKYIELSHQYLGNKSRCNAHSGEYLLLVLDYLINRCTEDHDDQIWRCFFCLYGYSKKNYTFKPHCNSHVKMSWDNCQLIYTYVQPEDIPEFDTANKSNTITSEIRDLLLQIIELIPNTHHPKNYLEQLDDYLNNGKSLQQTRNFQPHVVTQDIFYLIADYYFKNKEFDKAIQYYRLDICAGHHRFDSWAALALILTSYIEEQILNDTPSYYDANSIYIKSVQVIRCFSNALRLDRENTKIWVEFGNFCYNIGSYTSKIKKTILYFDLHEQEKPKTSIDELDRRIEEMFQHTEYCFKSSLKTDCDDELWLHYYVLGKIEEKHNALKALYYYDLADKALYLSGACYPSKINYNNQQNLSIEALEIHYRIHACALKSLLSGKKMRIKSLSKIRMYLSSALRSPFARHTEKERNIIEHKYNKTEHQEGVFNALNDLLDLTVERVENKEDQIKVAIINLCILGLKRCIIRFQNHYRSYYRLAHYYFVIGNFKAAKSILLDSFDDIDILNGKQTILPGLFYDRKSNNFFNGVWRIPVDDIERPGSFSNHMYKCILLLIQVCTGQGDYNFLISNLVINLHRTPDVNKKYLRDCERLGLAKKAFENACFLMASNLAAQPTKESKLEKLFEINRLLDKLTKMNLFVRKIQEVLNQLTRIAQLMN